MEGIRNRAADSEEDPSILEEILLGGMSIQDAVVIMVDMLLAGIDTVTLNIINLTNKIFSYFNKICLIDFSFEKFLAVLVGEESGEAGKVAQRNLVCCRTERQFRTTCCVK